MNNGWSALAGQGTKSWLFFINNLLLVPLCLDQYTVRVIPLTRMERVMEPEVINKLLLWIRFSLAKWHCRAETTWEVHLRKSKNISSEIPPHLYKYCTGGSSWNQCCFIVYKLHSSWDVIQRFKEIMRCFQSCERKFMNFFCSPALWEAVDLDVDYTESQHFVVQSFYGHVEPFKLKIVLYMSHKLQHAEHLYKRVRWSNGL